MGGKETDHENAQGSLNNTSLVSKCWSGGDVSFKNTKHITNSIP